MSPAGAALLDRWLSGNHDDRDAESPSAKALRRRLVSAGMLHPIVANGRPPGGARTSAAFVVPVFRDADGLAHLLRALRRDRPGDRIVVVDDASPANEADEIAEVADRYRAELVRHTENRGPAAARNTGRAQLGSDGVIVFLDADVVPSPGALDRMLAQFADEAVVAVAPRVRAMPGTSTIDRYEADNSPLDMGADRSLVHPFTRRSYVPSAVLAVRLSSFDAVDGFDEVMRFGEDVDLVWRLIDRGGLIRYEPDAVVEHRSRPRLRDFARQRFSYGSSAVLLAERHGDKVAPLQLPGAVVASTLGLVAGGSRVRSVALSAAALGAVPLARRLRSRLPEPGIEAVRLTTAMHVYAIQGLASGATRTWAPLLVVTRRTRRLLAAALVLPAMVDWMRARPATNPVTHLAMRALDHGAYCAGLWASALRRRSFAALLPSVRIADRLDDTA